MKKEIGRLTTFACRSLGVSDGSQGQRLEVQNGLEAEALRRCLRPEPTVEGPSVSRVSEPAVGARGFGELAGLVKFHSGHRAMTSCAMRIPGVIVK